MKLISAGVLIGAMASMVLLSHSSFASGLFIPPPPKLKNGKKDKKKDEKKGDKKQQTKSGER